MTSYTVHEPPQPSIDELQKVDRIQFVKNGFSWLALLFPFLWTIYHRMWLVLVCFAVMMTALQGAALLIGASEAVSAYLSILLSLVFAFEANDLRRWTLERNGYRLTGAVTGATRDECELKFFSKWLRSKAYSADLTRIATQLTSGAVPGTPAPRLSS